MSNNVSLTYITCMPSNRLENLRKSLQNNHRALFEGKQLRCCKLGHFVGCFLSFLSFIDSYHFTEYF